MHVLAGPRYPHHALNGPCSTLSLSPPTAKTLMGIVFPSPCLCHYAVVRCVVIGRGQLG